MHICLVLFLFILQEQNDNPMMTVPVCPENSPNISILLIHTQQCKVHVYGVLAALGKADPYCHFHNISYPNWQGLYSIPNPAFLRLLNVRTTAL